MVLTVLESLSPARLLLCLLAIVPLSSHGFDPLALAPEPVSVPEHKTRHSGLRLEAWLQHFDWRFKPPGAVGSQQRLLLDFRREWALGAAAPEEVLAAWLTLSNRLEWVHHAGLTETRHTLRELFLSTEPAPKLFIDLGRINWRNGVGYGFNPTDFLGRGATIEQASLDPRTQRENRLGTVMLRAQYLHDTGTASLALIPSLASSSSNNPRSFAWHRSNPNSAALLKLSPKLNERTSLDLLSYWQRGHQAQTGMNLTWLASDALILHAELAKGRDSTTRWRHDIAAGFSWTSSAGPQITLEWTRDQSSQSRSVFTRFAWSRAFDRPDLSLNGFVRHDIDTRARAAQLEVNWHHDAQQSISLIFGHLTKGNLGTRSIPLQRYFTMTWARHF